MIYIDKDGKQTNYDDDSVACYMRQEQGHYIRFGRTGSDACILKGYPSNELIYRRARGYVQDGVTTTAAVTAVGMLMEVNP